MADITEEDIQHTEGNTKADGKSDLDNQHGDKCQERPTRKVTADQQEDTEQAENDGEIEAGVEYHDNREAQAREAELLEQVGVFEENILGASGYFGKEPPSEHTGTKIDAIGEGAVHTR